MTALHTVALPEPYGELTLTESPDLTSGQVRYVVSGRRASGAFTIEPAFADEELIPPRIRVRFGHEPSQQQGAGLVNRPVINGIALAGGADLDPDLREPLRRRHLMLYRVAGSRIADAVPDKTAEYAAAIITVLRTMWSTHPLRPTLVTTWARLCAEQRAEYVLRDELAHRYRTRDKLTAEIRQYERRVEDLRALAMTGADAVVSGSVSGDGQRALQGSAQVGSAAHAAGVVGEA
ncbi:hypothetical protein AB0I95_10840 [Micromonospora sp. NPDC049751]|uniref:hypothetical protein n=1 Tax=Micromonospora sp. NPDC049751 TaxID=3154837 RepID=UPI003401A230